MIFDNKYKIIPQEFYNRIPQKVAKDLLGKYLVRIYDSVILIGKIVEVEAYLAKNDPASHSFRGETKRNKSQFGPPGTAYIHQIRSHLLIDVVVQKEGVAGSVLLRSLEPVLGVEEMSINRKVKDFETLTSGPGKLTQALKIGKDFDGADLTDKKIGLFITENKTKENFEIGISERIGLGKATQMLLRYFIKNNCCVSKRPLKVTNS